MASSSSSSLFKFVLIPANDAEPLEELTGDGSGGLTNDQLVLHAKNYFYELTGAKKRIEMLQKASPAEKAQIANQIRQQMANQPAANIPKDDETLLNMLYAHQSQPNCDIIALTIPLPENNHHAVSLYLADQAKEAGLPVNKRATELVTACGRAGQQAIYGNVFCGRALDNEVADIWKRIDFTKDDTRPSAAWVQQVRRSGSKSSSGSGAMSLSGILQQQATGGGASSTPAPAIQQHNYQMAQSTDPNYGLDGAPPVVQDWGTWTQTNEEVELVLPHLPPGTKAKDVQVQFARNHLSVTTPHHGTLWTKAPLYDPIEVDESTFTLQTSTTSSQDAPGERELCITLTKANPNVTWTTIVTEK